MVNGATQAAGSHVVKQPLVHLQLSIQVATQGGGAVSNAFRPGRPVPALICSAALEMSAMKMGFAHQLNPLCNPQHHLIE